MYTILLNDTNELITSVRERIMQRSKLVDNLHFLVDPMYKDVSMSDFTVMMEYILPVSREYKTEILVKSDDLYKDKLEYKLPFDTCLTKEAGKIEVQLTFVKADLSPEGEPIQQVRKTSPTTITIVPIAAWSDIIADGALSALDQRLIQAEAMLNAVNEMNMYLEETKVDGLVYDDQAETLQLSANGVGIGDKVSVRDMLDDGIPVVDLNSGAGSDSETTPDNPQCNCGCEDNVVEFGDSTTPSQPQDNQDIVEF